MFKDATRALVAIIVFGISAHCQASRDDDDFVDSSEETGGDPQTRDPQQDSSHKHDGEDFNQDLIDLASQLDCMNSWIAHFGLLRSNATQLKKGMVQLAGALHLVRKAAHQRDPKFNSVTDGVGDVLVSGLTSDKKDPFDVSLTRTEQVLSHLLQAAQKYHSALVGLVDSAYWEILHNSCGESKADAPRVSGYFPAHNAEAMPNLPKAAPSREEEGGGAQSLFAHQGSSTASLNQDVATSSVDGTQEPQVFQQGGNPTFGAQLGFDSAHKGEVSKISDNQGSGLTDEFHHGHETDQRHSGQGRDRGSAVQQSSKLSWPHEIPIRHGNTRFHGHTLQDPVTTEHHRYAPEPESGAQVDGTNAANIDERRPLTHYRQAVGFESNMDRTQRIWWENQMALRSNTKARTGPYLKTLAASHTSERGLVPRLESSQRPDVKQKAQDRQQVWSVGRKTLGYETMSSRLEAQASDSPMSDSRLSRPDPMMTPMDQIEGPMRTSRSANDAFGFDPVFPDQEEYPMQRQDLVMDGAQSGRHSEAPMQIRFDQVPNMQGDSGDSSRSGHSSHEAAQEALEGTERLQATFEHHNDLIMPSGSDENHGGEDSRDDSRFLQQLGHESWAEYGEQDQSTPHGRESFPKLFDFGSHSSGWAEPDDDLLDVVPQHWQERQIDEVGSAVPHSQPSAVRPEFLEPERRGREIIDSSMQQPGREPGNLYEAPQVDPHAESRYEDVVMGASSGDSLAGLQSTYIEESTRVMARIAANLWPEGYLTPVERGRKTLCFEGYIAWC